MSESKVLSTLYRIVSMEKWMLILKTCAFNSKKKKVSVGSLDKIGHYIMYTP